MKSVCLQAGHQNIAANCRVDMRGSTGASGEASWTPTMRGKVASRLRAHGIAVTEVDANVNCAKVHPRYDLTVAIHYQSWNGKPVNAGGNSGFGVFVADPSVDRDIATSIKYAKPIAHVYHARTGLADYSDPRVKGAGATWANPNTTLYYVWRTQEGPLVLIECGVGAPGAPDSALLHLHSDRVADAIAEGICAALGITWAPAVVPAVVVPEPAKPGPDGDAIEDRDHSIQEGEAHLPADKTRDDADALMQRIIDLMASGDGVEAGFKTTEFWLMVLALAADFAGPSLGLSIDGNERMLIAAGLVSAWTAFRSWRKRGGPAKLYADVLKALAELRHATA